jgi:hypothetical protein
MARFPNLAFFAVNCNQEKDICRGLGLTKYPFLQFMFNNQTITKQGKLLAA